MFQGRSLPATDTDPFSYYTSHACVRDYVEAATDSTPGVMIDYAVYSLVLNWCIVPDKVKVVVETLATRLGLPPPAGDKAVILAQAVPVPSLGPLLDGLKTHRDHASPFIAAIATQLHIAGEASKADQEESAKKAEEQAKWDTWSALYGKSKADWRGLPKEEEMGWGWWIAQDVGAEEWWCVAPKTKEDEKEMHDKFHAFYTFGVKMINPHSPNSSGRRYSELLERRISAKRLKDTETQVDVMRKEQERLGQV